MITAASLTLAAGELATAERQLAALVDDAAARLSRLDSTAESSVAWWAGPRSDDFRSGNDTFVGHMEPVAPAAAEAIGQIARLSRLAGELARELRSVEDSLPDATVRLVRARIDPLRAIGDDATERSAIAEVVRLERRRQTITAHWMSEAATTTRSLLATAESIPSVSTVTLGGPSAQLARLAGFGASTPSDPRAIADWWASLPPATRAALVATAPELVGNTDGVPFADRADANALAMQAVLDRSRPGSRLWGTLQQFVGVDGQIDPTRRFVVFDAAADGRIAEVFGDPVTAEHLAIMVPGMGSTMAGFNDLSGRGRRLHAAAGADTAIIAWTGYDAPHALAASPAVFEVTSDAQAVAGGELLHGFVDGVQAQSDAAVTLIGHSYGSLTVGKALHDGTQVERVVLMGSPGVDADHVDDFPPGAAGEFFASEIKGDIVANLEHFGENPTDPDFGAFVFDSGDGDGLQPISRHGEYYDDGIAIENLVAIVTGGEPTPGRTDAVEYLTEPLEDIDQAFHDGIDRIQEFDVPLVDDRFIDGPIDAVQSVGQTFSQARELLIEEAGHFGQDVIEWGVEWGAGEIDDAVDWGVGELGEAWDDGVETLTGWLR